MAYLIKTQHVFSGFIVHLEDILVRLTVRYANIDSYS